MTERASIHQEELAEDWLLAAEGTQPRKIAPLRCIALAMLLIRSAEPLEDYWSA